MFRRAGAFILDGVLLSCALAIFSELTGWADVETGAGSTASGEPLFGMGVNFRFDSTGDMLLAAVAFVLFKSVAESLFGKTPGKRLTGLVVAAESDGAPVSWKQAFLRNVLLVPSGALLFLPSLIPILVNQGRRISDSLFGTLVIREDVKLAANESISEQPIERQYDWQPETGSVIRSKSVPWYRTTAMRVMFGLVAAAGLLWAALEYDIIHFQGSTDASDPLQSGEIFRKGFDEEFDEQESEFGRYFWQDGTAVFETNMPFVMANRYFKVESPEEALNLSVSVSRLNGGDGIASLQWGLDENSTRVYAVYVAWTGDAVTCAVVMTESASEPAVHLKLPTEYCGQPTDDEWYQLEIASDGTTFTFLVNGVEQVSEQSSENPQSIGFGAEKLGMGDSAFLAQFDDLILREAA